MGGDGATGAGSLEEFFSLLRFTRAEGRPRTGNQLMSDASNVVRGNFSDVRDGRVIDFASGASNPVQTAVFEISIAKTLKGSGAQTAYMEFIRGGIEVNAIHRLLPTKLDMIIFLHSADGWDPKVYRIEGAEKGHPSGTLLQTYLTQEGLVIGVAEGLRHPLADDPDQPIFDPARIKTLDDLEKEFVH
jgi:hypothetical protein